MKLSVFAILLISLSACEENCVSSPKKSSDNSTSFDNTGPAGDKADIEKKAKDVLDNEAELKDFFTNVIKKDLTPILNQIKNAKNASEQETALKSFAQAINTKDDNGFTPFHLVIDEKNDKLINLMIQSGADINEVDRNKMSPLKKASLINDEKLVEILINAPDIDLAKNNTLKWAIEEDNLKIAKMLLDKGVTLNSIDENGYTYLHLAVLKKKADILNELIKTNAIDINAKDNHNNTALHLARSAELVDILIKADADINAVNEFGETPLALAIKFNEKDIENLLKSKGAKLAAVDKAEIDKKDEKSKNFMSTPFSYSYAVPTINMSTTKQYDGYAPQAPFIADYDGNGVHSYMAIKLSSSFSKNLPEKIKEELEKYKIEEDKIDIFLVIQGLSRISEKTQIKAHGWADPDAPYESDAPYDRVKREFLYGIYESDLDISEQVKLNELKEFPINTHLNQDKVKGPWQIVYSPPEGAIVNIPNDDRNNIAFYSLVIDNNNPEGNIRAAVTLHWLLLGEGPFQKEIYADSKRGDRKYLPPSGVGPEKDALEIKKYKNIGELIKFWQEESILKDTTLVQKLTDLIKQ